MQIDVYIYALLCLYLYNFCRNNLYYTGTVSCFEVYITNLKTDTFGVFLLCSVTAKCNSAALQPRRG